MTTTLGKRIKKAREDAGLSQQGLADAIGNVGGDTKKISRTAIAQWESGVTKGVEAANLLKATQVLNIRPEWLQFGTGSMRPVNYHIDNQPIGINAHHVPIISYSQATNHMERDNIACYVGIDQKLAEVASSLSFALVVSCNSMLPVINIGDIVIIDPTIKPQPGEIVAAKLAYEKQVVVRKYRPLANPTGLVFTPFELIALNEDWPKIVVQRQNEGSVVGTLIELRCHRRIALSNK